MVRSTKPHSFRRSLRLPVSRRVPKIGPRPPLHRSNREPSPNRRCDRLQQTLSIAKIMPGQVLALGLSPRHRVVVSTQECDHSREVFENTCRSKRPRRRIRRARDTLYLECCYCSATCIMALGSGYLIKPSAGDAPPGLSKHTPKDIHGTRRDSTSRGTNLSYGGSRKIVQGANNAICVCRGTRMDRTPYGAVFATPLNHLGWMPRCANLLKPQVRRLLIEARASPSSQTKVTNASRGGFFSL